jgi:hypothetical protein
MMSCREVALALSSGAGESASIGSRAAVWMHLAMCRHCRAFREQLRRFTMLVRRTARGVKHEPASTFEAEIVDTLGAP